MPMSDYEKLIWEELKEIRHDIKSIREYMESEVDEVKDEVAKLKTSQAISKVKLGAIITGLSVIFSSIVGVIIRKIL